MIFQWVVSLAGLTTTLRELFPEIGVIVGTDEDSLLMTEGKWLEALGKIVRFCPSKSEPKMDWSIPLSKSEPKMDWLLYAGPTAKPLIECETMKRSGINNNNNRK